MSDNRSGAVGNAGGPPPRTAGTAPRGSTGSWASGGTMFAGVLMLVTGVLGVLNGIAAIAEDEVYERVGDYVYKFDLTTWGWIHLVLGVLVAVTGWGVLKGALWARVAGVSLAALVVVVNFMWLPYQPLWALVAIAIGVFAIWALCTDDGADTAF